MDRNALWKWLLLIALVAWSMVLVTPFDEKVKLGLDLQGGTGFVLELADVDPDADTRRDLQERTIEVIRNRVDAMGIAEPIIYPERANRIVVQMPGLEPEDRERALQNLKSAAFLEFRMVHQDNERLTGELFRDGLAPPGYRIVQIDQTGRDGRRYSRYYYQRDEEAVPEHLSPEEWESRVRQFNAPAGHELLMIEEEVQGRNVYTPFFVNRKAELTGEHLETAGVDYQTYGQPIVTLSFDSRGARLFGRLTAAYAPGGDRNPSLDSRRYLAIVLDGRLYSAPFIRSEIRGGDAIIEGGFSLDEAQDLAIVLRAGALPAEVNVIEERAVDPSLGRDSIASGKMAAILAGMVVLAFMLIYYRLAGVVANMALVLNFLLLPLGMMLTSGFMGLLTGGAHLGGTGAISLPTLTLPGIAGIVLMIGMAVDANVLIFERIREEQLSGTKKFGANVTAGYQKAFSTIFDANITTLLTALILFWQGSGPVRGFAVTLSAGIIVSMYTALVVTRMIFQQFGDRLRIERLKMMSLLRETSIDFLGKRGIAAVVSVGLIVITMGFFAVRGSDNFGVDFTGGRSLVFDFEERQPVQDVRETLSQAGVHNVFLQYQREMGVERDEGTGEYLEIKVDFDDGDLARETLLETYGHAGFRVLQEDSVGPQVGRELQRQALIAVIVALVGIVIYISARFEFAFAAGAISALAHDVLITVGLFCLFGRQLSLPIMAALLTIVGYSVNDSIVVFDRIREDLKLMRGKPYAEIANLSINQTLSRTLLTSLTTLLSVLVLLLFGGGAINDFALALFIGVMVGTYSSIFVATPVMLLWHREKPAEA